MAHTPTLEKVVGQSRLARALGRNVHLKMALSRKKKKIGKEFCHIARGQINPLFVP